MFLVATSFALARVARGEPADAKAVAREKALEGSRVADQGEHQRAFELFREAYGLYPEPAYLYDMGVECQALGRDVEAFDAYTRFLADPRNTPPDLVTHATELHAELEKRLGRIHLRGAPEDAAIDIDEQPHRSGPSQRPVRAKAGIHRVVVRRHGFESFRTDIRVPEGGTVLVDVPELKPTDPSSYLGSEGKPWLSWAFSLGAGFWTAGPPKGTGPSPALGIAAGRSLASLPGEIDFQLGARFGLTYFTEPAKSSTFVSLLANPRLVRSLGDRLSIFGEAGVGVLVLAGVPDNSVLLEPKGGRVTGALTTFELRPTLGLAYALSDRISLHIAPAFIWNPSPSERFRHASLTRVELGLGLMGEL